MSYLDIEMTLQTFKNYSCNQMMTHFYTCYIFPCDCKHVIFLRDEECEKCVLSFHFLRALIVELFQEYFRLTDIHQFSQFKLIYLWIIQMVYKFKEGD